MKYFIYLLAYRYITSMWYKKSIQLLLLTGILSIALATGSLALIISIVRGFEVATISCLQGINPDIIIATHQGSLDIKKIKEIVKNDTEVAALTPFIMRQGLINKKKSSEIPQLATIKIIEPTSEQNSTALYKTIVKPDKNNLLSDILNNDQIMIGYQLAHTLQVTVGDHVILIVPDLENDYQNYIKKELKIGGIIKTGIEDFDATITVCSFKTWHHFEKDTDITHVGIRKNDDASIDQCVTMLKKKFPGVHIYPWTHLYPAVLEALALEKYTFLLVMVLIIIMACMNIVAIITIILTLKKHDMAILQIHGLSFKDLKKIFIVIGTSFGTIASFLGLTCALCCALLLKYYLKIPLPHAYYVSHMPVLIEFHYFFAIFLLAVFISWITTLIALRNCQVPSIIQLLKIES